METSDGYIWKCKRCAKVSIPKDSFFSNSHLRLGQVICIAYGWCCDFPRHIIAYEAALRNSMHTIVDWCLFCRDICEQYLTEHPSVIGGSGDNLISKVAEIDKNKFFHRKYHRDLWQNGHWVSGGIEQGSGECFLVEVANRNQETLTVIIRQYIRPESTIVSDGWRAYNNINNIDGGIYEHIDPHDRRIHTQHVEYMWMRAKQKLRRQFGTS